MAEQFNLGFSDGIPGDDAPPITHITGYLSPEQRQALLTEARDYAFSSPEVQVYGKWHKIPREQLWLGDEGCQYQYSSLLIEPAPWPRYALKLKEKLNREFGAGFNGCLVNHYRDGRDAMGFHADNEPELVASAPVAIVSLGQARPFVMRRRADGHKVRLMLQSGDLLLMHAPMQALWEHAIPRSERPMDARLSFTFRRLSAFYHRAC
ncbi:alpha-ketoglutarate-dependent dioxygenase AlkB family protein [Shewanella khirikhana]|uniref:Fe2OG dioxygenase domain-containing protein n=1 Tax=Shewanella khirikhana TaxID=1965282 RepID=A0ABN5TYJ2_9GAMM|nr:alpha-ketoglutarate-dependent dioxygenase AlkB [Shewanella khirikhana]AZQ11427.1 hypothetical protein STH12_02341 [Shewanella khirikhana]